MATYQDLKGLRVKYLSADPSTFAGGEVWYNSTTGTLKTLVASAAWSSGASLITARLAGSGFGTQTAGVLAGGRVGPPGGTTVTEEYNGAGWAVGGALNTSKQYSAGAGILTAGLSFGGDNPSGSALAKTEEYNGTSWTENPSPSGDMGTGRAKMAGFGAQDSALAAGGGPPTVTTTEEYTGTTWAAGGVLSQARQYLAGAGAGIPAGLAFGGTDGNSTKFANTEEYNGTAWAAGGDLNTARGQIAGCGTQTAALAIAGSPAPTATESYDGSTWTTSPATLATGRYDTNGIGTRTAALAAGGDPGVLSATEEFNLSTSVTTAGAWAAGANLNTGRQRAGGFGNAQTAAVAAGGATAPPASALDKSEEYNGTSWAEGNAINTARYNMTAFGILTAGVLAGVGSPGVTYGGTTELYDGTNWTTGNPYAAPGANYRSSCGPAAAGLLAGGVAPAPAEMTNAVEEFDGANWTNGTVLPQYQSYQNMAGTQTAAINGGGNKGPAAPGPVTANDISLEYDGSTWTAGPNGNLYTDRTNSFNGGSGTQTAAMFVGGDGAGTSTYDGTTFSTAPTNAASRGETNAAGIAPSTACIVFCGAPVPSIGNTTEEFTGATTALDSASTITTS